MRGFTLIETIIVMAIISILALAGVGTITSFQKSAILNNTANELAASLRNARAKSITGEFGEALINKNPEDFLISGLPKYGVGIDNQNYILIQKYQLTTDTDPVVVSLESFPINSQLTINPVSQITFARLTGRTPSTTFMVQRADNGEKIEVRVDEKGVFLIK